jgi:hypothetical protein
MRPAFSFSGLFLSQNKKHPAESREILPGLALALDLGFPSKIPAQPYG